MESNAFECPGTQRLLNFLGPYYDTIRHTHASMLTELNVWSASPTGNQTIMLCQINTLLLLLLLLLHIELAKHFLLEHFTND